MHFHLWLPLVKHSTHLVPSSTTPDKYCNPLSVFLDIAHHSQYACVSLTLRKLPSRTSPSATMFSALRTCSGRLSRSLPNATFGARALRSVQLSSQSQSTTALRLLASQRLANISIAGFHHSTKWQQIATQQAERSETTPEEQLATQEHAPVTEFADLATKGLVHPNIVNVITQRMKLTTMTDVQSKTINEALSGVDM